YLLGLGWGGRRVRPPFSLPILQIHLQIYAIHLQDLCVCHVQTLREGVSMMMPRPIRFLLFWTCVVSVLAFLGSIRARQVQSERSRPYGRYTAQQVMDRSEPLCRALAAQNSRLTLSA